MTLLDALKARLRESEGIRPQMYLCPAGKRTVGVGFNLERDDARDLCDRLGIDYDAVLAGAPLSPSKIEDLLDVTARQSITQAAGLDCRWTALPVAVQAILADLVFNMGPGKVREFRRFLAAVRECDWEAAAHHLADSKWYHQVGDRSRRIVAELAQLALEGRT